MPRPEIRCIGAGDRKPVESVLLGNSIKELRRKDASGAENIALGDWSQPADITSIREAARAAGADFVIERLPRGYDQLLGNWFESGSELSFGEWQRIALARAFARRAPILVLDEPTSAMDPWAEADWLDRFRALAAGRTVLIITHRFHHRYVRRPNPRHA